MGRFLVAVMLASASGGAVLAQSPSAPASPSGATTTIDQDKQGNATPAQTQPRSASARPGTAPLPMNIKIQGEGIKLPACTAESREGEACKK